MIGHNRVLVEALATERQATFRREAAEDRLARLLRRSTRRIVPAHQPATSEDLVARFVGDIDRHDMDQVA